MSRLLILTASVVLALAGCSNPPMSSDSPAKDPYAGMKPEVKIQAIRDDPKINSMSKSQQIADAQKAAGLPVTGN